MIDKRTKVLRWERFLLIVYGLFGIVFNIYIRTVISATGLH
jgi:hypothetical protein